jgi:hypothetical protein
VLGMERKAGHYAYQEVEALGTSENTPETMFITLSTYGSVDILRADTNANWTYRGAYALVSHMEELEEDTGEPVELDAVALRCEFSEFASATECVLEYMNADEAHELFADADGLIEEDSAIEWLCDRTTVIQIDGHILPNGFNDTFGRLIVRSF